jgi:hypothetical protein
MKIFSSKGENLAAATATNSFAAYDKLRRRAAARQQDVGGKISG